MAVKKQTAPHVEIFPLLRELMDNGEIEYVQNGNRRLLCEAAIWDWYNRHKVPVRVAVEA